MVISKTYRYIFIELPRTGTTAISKELCDNYGGKKILHKHSTYGNFLKIASEEEKKYFVFSCIRNPLDRTVSLYIKLKTGQKTIVSSGWNIKFLISELFFARRYYYLKRTQAKFADYFNKFYKLPYDDMSSISYKYCDYFIYFENMQKDFARVLQLIGIKQIRDIPFVNITDKKKKDFLSYYIPSTHKRAKRLFGPYMEKWGYKFPLNWGKVENSNILRYQWKVLFRIRKILWNYFQ